MHANLLSRRQRFNSQAPNRLRFRFCPCRRGHVRLARQSELLRLFSLSQPAPDAARASIGCRSHIARMPLVRLPGATRLWLRIRGGRVGRSWPILCRTRAKVANSRDLGGWWAKLCSRACARCLLGRVVCAWRGGLPRPGALRAWGQLTAFGVKEGKGVVVWVPAARTSANEMLPTGAFVPKHTRSSIALHSEYAGPPRGTTFGTHRYFVGEIRNSVLLEQRQASFSEACVGLHSF